jgi:hypothetical protein
MLQLCADTTRFERPLAISRRREAEAMRHILISILPMWFHPGDDTPEEQQSSRGRRDHSGLICCNFSHDT